MTRWAVRIGLRNAFLVVMGAGWIGYGVGILFDPQSGTVRARGVSDVTQYIPLNALGWVWLAFGSVAAVAALLPWPRLKAAGFTALAMPAALWGVSFLIAWASDRLPSAAGAASVWIAFTIGITLVSGMDDPPRRQTREGV